MQKPDYSKATVQTKQYLYEGDAPHGYWRYLLFDEDGEYLEGSAFIFDSSEEAKAAGLEVLASLALLPKDLSDAGFLLGDP